MLTFEIHDLDKRKLALDSTKSFIVQAPAGSGKTTLLVERYLTLLAQVNNPEEIVAITFTRKAAHEMRARIIAALSQSATICNQQNQIKKWNLIQNPTRLRIQTIDAFCYYLISQAPIFTKINPNFQIVQNQEAEIYYSKAARAVLENISDPQYSEHLESLLLHLDNDWERVENLFITMLKSREQWLPHIIGLKNTEELRQKMELALCEIAQENIKRCISLFPKNLYRELVELLKTSQVNHDDLPPSLQNITYEEGCFKSSLSCWQNVAHILLTQKFSWRKQVNKNQGFPATNSKDHKTKQELFKSLKTQMESLLTTFSQHENLRASLENILLSPPPNYGDQQWIIIDALLELLPFLAAHLKVIFNENIVTDHSEISMAALRVLGDQDSPSDFALNLDYRLQHLLIDEFQDTSLSHYRLIEKLITTWQQNDGRTIFIVGDPMQSIYRFREAEVGLFLRVAKEGIGDLKLQPLTLTTNFRSTQNITAWINHNFAKIMPALADITLGTVPFKPATAINNDTNSLVKITLLKDAKDETEAMQVTSTIKKILEQHPDDTIAILVRARRHLQKIIPALRKAKLDYQAFELETLNESMVIRDLFSLTRALFDLADRIAWIAILRAPWCGLNLIDLHKIANGEAELIWDNIVNHKALNLSEDGDYRLTKLKAQLLPILEQRGRINWQELIEKAWLLIGGPATVTDKIALEHATAYLELLNDTLDINLLQKKLDTLYTPPTATAKIQIMTIHKAKGLEFDHVIIPAIDRPTRFDERKLMLWYERPKLHRGSNLLLAPIALTSNNTDLIYKYLQSIEQKKEFYETGRLLYVAMTRAKKSTYVIAQIDYHHDEYQYPVGSLLEQLKPCFNENWVFDSKRPCANDLSHPQEVCQNSAQRVRLSSAWELPITIDMPNNHNKPLFELTDNRATIIGTVIHQCFRQLSEVFSENDSDWAENYIIEQQPYWHKFLQQEGYLDLDYGLKLINTAIKNTLKDQRGRWILTKHKDAASELAVTAKINDNFTHYIIDRTFIDENEIRWIIDYKTSQPNDENIEKFFTEETAKYSPQLLQYYQVMHDLDSTRIIKLGLYFPLIAGWVEVKR